MNSKIWTIVALLPILVALLVVVVDIPFKPSASQCSLYPHNHFWIASKCIVTPEGIISGAVETKGGNIASVVEGDHWRNSVKSQQVIEYGDVVIMPGLIDVHAHLDDPGREDWEGFPSGTRAAAAGGITTLIDMPLNSFPSTVSEETLGLKLQAAEGRIYVDVGFWGGLVPENALNTSSLEGLLNAGVLGLKEGLIALAKYQRPLLVHAECPRDHGGHSKRIDGFEDQGRSHHWGEVGHPPQWWPVAKGGSTPFSRGRPSRLDLQRGCGPRGGDWWRRNEKMKGEWRW